MGSQQVQVSGDVVNMAKTGTYKIKYDCKDAAGNKAPTTVRTVIVRDTTCPSSLDGTLKARTLGNVNTELTGTYKLTYRTKDKSGNVNNGSNGCKKGQREVIRTVTVKDTLKPVIALHFGGKKIHES